MAALEMVLFRHLPRTKIKIAIARAIHGVLRLFLRDDRHQITRGGIRYDVDISEGLDLSLYLFGSFQKYVTDLKYLDLPDDAIVLDVGANAGATALRYAKRFRRGEVYAFEPTDSGFARLSRNLMLNPQLNPRIVPVQSFVSDFATPSPGITAYSSWDLKTRPSQIRHAVHGGVAATADGVGAITLDSFCEDRGIDRVDFIKIDTDGHELPVLKGAVGIIKAHRPAVLFEVGLYLLEERGISFELFCDFFSSLGYKMINAENGRPISRAGYDREIPAKATIDILALPSAAADGRAITAGETPPRAKPRSHRTRVVVIGGGVAGLVASRKVAQNSDADVVLIEHADHLGGLASSINIERDIQIERFYHFICKPDRAYFGLMKELGIIDHLRWKTTEMGLYHDGTLSTLGDPLSLAQFKPLKWRDKYRFARASAGVKWAGEEGWQKIEHSTAKEWLIEQYGKSTYV